tara:strand:- start:838 stop:1581 length:744 start_codon:yes stop_codon:yes gene_type:complete
MEKYTCEYCKYVTDKKYNYNRHLKKHEKTKKKFFKVCECGKTYKSRHGYYKHVKNCAKTLEKEKKYVINNITNNIQNTNNISINFYLDNYCNNAKNLTDFIKNLKYTLEDVMNAHVNGYSSGITNVVLKGLEGMPVVERPIHCSDKKSGQLFIRDNNQWEEDNIKNKGKAYSIISKMRAKQYVALEEWEKANPGWELNEEKSLERCKIINSLLGDDKKLEKETQKILKDVAKNVVIDNIENLKKNEK